MRRSCLLPLVLLLAGPLAADPTARPVVLHRTDGRAVEGDLVDFTPPGTYVVLAAGGRIEVARADVAEVEFTGLAGRLARWSVAAERPDPDRLGDLVGRLGAAGFEVRQAAEVELRRLGRRALGALRRASNDADPEIAARALALSRELGQEVHRSRLADGGRLDLLGPAAGRGRRHRDLVFRRDRLEVGFAGSDFGHFIDLGPVSADDVGFVGARLVVEDRPVPCYELFARWTDPAPMHLVRSVSPRPGHAYAFRSVGRDRDLVVLLEVEAYGEDSIDLAWQEILVDGPEAMAGRRRAEEADWRARLAGRDEGTVVLWARSVHGDYCKATVSFEHGTRDHVGVAGNDWDLEYGNGRGPAAAVRTVVDDRSGIRAVELEDEETAGRRDLPADGYVARLDLVEGGLYAVHTIDRDSEVWAIVRVLEIGRDFVRIHWRRLDGGAASTAPRPR